MPSRALAGITGVLWIVYAAVRLTEPAYWAPVTPIDYAAVVIWSAAMLGLGLCLWTLTGAGGARIAARTAAVAAIANGSANLLEDFFRLRVFGSVFVVSALLTVIALVTMAVLLFRSGARAYGAAALLTVLGLGFVELGGSALVGATWLAVALRWPPQLRAVRNAMWTDVG